MHSEESFYNFEIRDVEKKFIPGSKFRIQALTNAYSMLAQRLTCMGLVRGATFEVAAISPLGDPIEIKSHGYNLSLRLKELSELELEQLSN